ncbi:MAG TPA: hypothetical protein VI957_02380 [Candidatus Paceibacterota bacterium]
MRGFFAKIIDALVPPSADVAVARTITETEFEKLFRPIVGPFPWIVSLFPYRDVRIRALIRAVKYRSEEAPLGALGRSIAEEIVETLSEKRALAGWQNVLLVPIPPSPLRMRERGYSQTERIAAHVLPHLPEMVLYAPKLLKREDRESQARLAREKRKENIAGAFFVPPAAVSAAVGAFVILLDDVVESGSTLSDARRALLDAGAKDVIAIAVAR